jgi:hypothetical protein
MRMRLVLGGALLLVVGALVLNMSKRAPRTAGSDHTSPSVLAVTVPGGSVLCEPELDLPNDAARAEMVIGAYGHALPTLRLEFIGRRGNIVGIGSLPAGSREGQVIIPVRHVSKGSPTKFCLYAGGHSNIILGGELGAIGPGSARVKNRPQPGRVALFYLRAGEESWWQLLPALAERFGLGKAAFLGAWLLPLAAILLLAVWIAAIRLLMREIRS